MPDCDNSLNTQKGRFFEDLAARVLAEHYGVRFETNAAIEIGDPPKLHKFDLRSVDGAYVGECKNYSWTKSGNVPSAKMGFCNQAVFYLSKLPGGSARFLCMRLDKRPNNGERLADYYYRTYGHLLDDVFVVEIDTTTGEVREIGQNAEG